MNNSDMKVEAMRIQSFINWPATSSIKARDLAAAGLFYVGEGDKVQCAFCGGNLSQWEQGDSPTAEHRKFYPNCPFVRGQNAGNVPVYQRLLSHDLEEDSPEASFDMPWSLDLDDVSSEAMAEPARYPNYSHIEDRLHTFERWPTDTGHTPEVMAATGFYYTGQHDRVTCYQCGGHLNGWRPEDDPWVEHARWYPHCKFMRVKKGPEYINLIRKRFVDYGIPAAAAAQANNVEHRVSLAAGGGPAAEAAANSSNFQASSVTQIPTPQLVSATTHLEDSRRIVDLTEEESKDIHHLLKENRELKETLTCKVCMDREANVVFLPCGHLVCCNNCAIPLRKCPVCRKTITKSVRTYMT